MFGLKKILDVCVDTNKRVRKMHNEDRLKAGILKSEREIRYLNALEEIENLALKHCSGKTLKVDMAEAFTTIAYIVDEIKPPMSLEDVWEKTKDD